MKQACLLYQRLLDSASAELSPHTLWCCASSFPLTRRHGVCRFGFSRTYAEWRLAVGWRAFSTTSLDPTGRLSLWGLLSISPISSWLAGWRLANAKLSAAERLRRGRFLKKQLCSKWRRSDC